MNRETGLAELIATDAPQGKQRYAMRAGHGGEKHQPFDDTIPAVLTSDLYITISWPS